MSTNKRGGFGRGVLFTLIFGALVGLVGGGLIARSGVVDVSARAPAPQDVVLQYASHRSIQHHAPKEANPLAHDAAALAHGIELYKVDCAPCHGGPHLPPGPFAAGLHPSAPDLALTEIQESFTDGMFFWTVSEGIGSTGMPSFAASLQPNDIWALVSVLRDLPHQKQLAAAAPKEDAAPPKGKLHRVTITGFKFDPPTLRLAAGDEVEWTNTDFVAHTATAEDKSFDTGTLDDGQKKRIAFPKPGPVKYVCTFHPSMKGSLQIK